jgi:molecular chaperone GrpE
MHPYRRYQIAPRRIPVRSRKNGIITAEQNIEDQNTVIRPDRADTRASISDKVAEPATDKTKTDWQTTALRLQADMDNFRKRQTRRADEAIAAERKRLLRLFLSVADNLDRALGHDDQGNETLRSGVELIYRELMRLLETEGVTRLETIGQPFTPSLHEAIATTLAKAESNTIIEEIEAGYKLDSELLRPARVVVVT